LAEAQTKAHEANRAAAEAFAANVLLIVRHVQARRRQRPAEHRRCAERPWCAHRARRAWHNSTGRNLLARM
jgi:hypothetical protein